MDVYTLTRELDRMIAVDSKIKHYQVHVGIADEARISKKDKVFFKVASEDFDHENKRLVLRITEDVVPASLAELIKEIMSREED